MKNTTTYEGGNISLDSKTITRLHGYVFSYLHFRTNNYHLAQDLTQEAMIKICNAIQSGKYTINGNILPRSRRIAYNELINYYRSQKKVLEVDWDDAISHPQEVSVETKMIEEETKKMLLYNMSLLVKEKRDVIEGHYYEGLLFREMEELWGIPERTLVSRAHDARKKLLQLMTQDQK